MAKRSTLDEFVSLSSLPENVEDIYSRIEREIEIIPCPVYGDLVGPKQWSTRPFDRWFKQKEAFSSRLVSMILDEFSISGPVLDPFSGSGTSLVAARSHGSPSVFGIECNPFLHLLSKVKTSIYSDRDLRAIAEARSPLNQPGEDADIYSLQGEILSNAFKNRLGEARQIMGRISRIEDAKAREFVIVAFGCIAERGSYTRKDGNGIKYTTRKDPEALSDLLSHQLDIMVEDVTSTLNSGCKASCILGDARNRSDYANIGQIESAIFSPPYCNCFDYTEVYKVEIAALRLASTHRGIENLRAASLSSHCNKAYDRPAREPISAPILARITWQETWGKRRLKDMAHHYFAEMKAVVANVDSILAPQGVAVCVIGNSAYDNIPIASDLIIAKFFTELGYRVQVRVARPLLTSSQQRHRLASSPYLRESVVIARKLPAGTTSSDGASPHEYPNHQARA